MTDSAIVEAIEGWRRWEDAIDRTRPPYVPAWMKVNGRRWATEPGE